MLGRRKRRDGAVTARSLVATMRTITTEFNRMAKVHNSTAVELRRQAANVAALAADVESTIKSLEEGSA